MGRLDATLRGAPGLLRAGAWRTEAADRIVALSLWETREAFEAALGRIGAAVANLPFGEWEVRPRELLRAEQVAWA